MNRSETDAILNVHRLAFGEAEGDEIAQLAEDLLEHPETISISIEREGQIAGNVMFTPFVFQDHPDIRCYLLAPCGVSPKHQGSGVGREMMETSINHLRSIGTDAVFVLGVPTFYPLFGFVPTDKETPYPDLLTIPEAWMTLELTAGSVGKLGGKVIAIEPFMHAHLWDTSQHE